MRLLTQIGRTKNNGLAPVYVVCYVQRERIRFQTGVDIEPKYYDIEAHDLITKGKSIKDSMLLVNNVKIPPTILTSLPITLSCLDKPPMPFPKQLMI